MSGEIGMNENGKCKGMLAERLLQYAVRIIGVARALPKSDIGRHIGMQMVRSGTSAGANYQEAVASESRRDFVHKIQIVLKELRETDYWPRVIKSSRLLPAKRLAKILQESDELIAMTVKSVVTAKGRVRHGR